MNAAITKIHGQICCIEIEERAFAQCLEARSERQSELARDSEICPIVSCKDLELVSGAYAKIGRILAIIIVFVEAISGTK